MAQGRKTTKQNTLPLDTFVILQILTFILCTSFSASLLNFFLSIDHPFTTPTFILLHISNLYTPKLVPLSTSYALILQFGQTKSSLLKDHLYGRIKVFHLAFDDGIDI